MHHVYAVCRISEREKHNIYRNYSACLLTAYVLFPFVTNIWTLPNVILLHLAAIWKYFLPTRTNLLNFLKVISNSRNPSFYFWKPKLIICINVSNSERFSNERLQEINFRFYSMKQRGLPWLRVKITSSLPLRWTKGQILLFYDEWQRLRCYGEP